MLRFMVAVGTLISSSLNFGGLAVSQSLESLRYKPEGGVSDSRNFSLT
jgi:hypothetical protein